MKYLIFFAVLAFAGQIFAEEAKCQDISTKYCQDRKELCNAPPLKSYMKKFCPMTCGYCEGPPPPPADDRVVDDFDLVAPRQELEELIESYDYDEECQDISTKYCQDRKELCNAPPLKSYMKKFCPMTCGYCEGPPPPPPTTELDEVEANDRPIVCVESRPDYCLKNSWLCQNPIFKKNMKEACPITCGYCDPVGTECEDADPDYCADKLRYCKTPQLKDFLKTHCKKTCGYCGTKPQPTQPPKPPTEPPTLPPGKTYPPLKGQCGVAEVKGVRVIAGTTPPRGAWPWQILLTYKHFPMCGGTLISPYWVVTAAHCVYRRESIPSLFKITVGEHDRSKREGSEHDYTVEKVIRHPQYDTRHLNNDIALLKLNRPVAFNKYVQPACLPSQDPPVGSQCYITGWGKIHHPGSMTTVLQQGLLPVVSNYQCNAKNYPHLGIHVTEDMVCGGSGGTDLISGCHGDSGGPFVCQFNGRWELHGSVSHGSPRCRSTDSYTVFSRTMHFKEWIKQQMAIH